MAGCSGDTELDHGGCCKGLGARGRGDEAEVISDIKRAWTTCTCT